MYRRRDGLKCGMRCSSRAVSEDRAIEAAKRMAHGGLSSLRDAPHYANWDILRPTLDLIG